MLIREAKHGGGWYVPAGRVEPGEGYVNAIKCETMEEAGVPITVVGIICIEHNYPQDNQRLRYIFLAEPADDTKPKDFADSESEEVAWFTLDEIEKLHLRGKGVLSMLRAVEKDPSYAPLSIMVQEGAAWL